MAVIYINADEDAYALLAELVAEYRDDLTGAEARITLLFAVGEEGKPAMKHHGFRVLGRCQVNSLQDRAEGKGDATITLDGEHWRGATDARRRALLHHELNHIARWGGKRDALDRPRLSTRPGDWQNDGFNDLVALYGADSCERRWLDSVEANLGQARLPFEGHGQGAA